MRGIAGCRYRLAGAPQGRIEVRQGGDTLLNHGSIPLAAVEMWAIGPDFRKGTARAIRDETRPD